MYCLALNMVKYNRPLFLCNFCLHLIGQQYQGTFKNESNNRNTKGSTLRARSIHYTDCTHNYIAIVYPKLVDLRLI